MHKYQFVAPFMDEESIQRLSSDECSEKLKEIRQYGLGTLEEMKMNLLKFSFYPKLYECLKHKVQRKCKFECSLNSSEVLGIRAKWSSDEKRSATKLSKWMGDFEKK